MPQVLKISTSGDFAKADRILTRFKKQLPPMTIDGMRKWGKILEKDMKLALRQKTSRFTGLSQGVGIQWRQGKRSYVGGLFMRHEYVAVDIMKPHHVSVKSSRVGLLRWARQSRSKWIRDKAEKVKSGKLKRFGVYVKPHPFINIGFKRARPKLTPILRSTISRGVRK